MATFRAGMNPPMPDEGAPGPLTRAQRMDRMIIGSKLSEEERARMSRMPMEPVSGEEVGMQKREEKVYKKKMAAGGSASSRADGCAQRGKTRGKMV